jgi:hypothetical protein
MLLVSLLPNLIGGEKGLHSPNSDDFTNMTSNLNDVTEALAGFHLPDQNVAKPGEGQSTWPYGLEGIAQSYQCHIKLMLGTQALTQVCALGPFLESSSDDNEESLTDSDESQISTAYPRFDGPEDLRRFLDNDDSLPRPCLSNQYTTPNSYHDLMEHDTRPLGHSSCKQSKN